MRRRKNVDPTLFDPNEDRLVQVADYPGGVPAFVLDVPESIPQLGYGTHQFFRYYGKFPSIVGREIVSRFGTSGAVLDCYAGSGTTLVEAQIAGRTSYGLDINPLAALACRAKTYYYADAPALRLLAAEVVSRARKSPPWQPPQKIAAKLDKWFSAETQDELARMRTVLGNLPDNQETEFLLTAYLGIVRRCSRAYDGEVRPHINPDKRERSPYEAFLAKVRDMVDGLLEVDSMRPPGIACTTRLGDNRDAAAYDFVQDDEVDLVVAHPPYLNSFNYLQVFSLEFYWADGLDLVWRGFEMPKIRSVEHKAWPATNADLVKKYYIDFDQTIKAVTSKLLTKGTIAVVIGDATIRGALEPVHSKMAQSMSDSGLHMTEIWYRTTHYGIGKYAYSHRADYHGEAEKKDAILFFRKD